MDRTKFLIDMLEAAAHKQHHISMILQTKAEEAYKARNWLCGRVNGLHFGDHDEQMRHSMEVHEHLIEMIDAMTKLEMSLGKNLRIVLGHQEEDQGGGPGMFNLGSMGGSLS